MDTEKQQIDVDSVLKERFAQLHPIIQKAVTGAEVENHLRSLSDTHKLHIDQWQVLENEVMMTLLGLQRAEELEENIKTEVGVDSETALALAEDITQAIFEPVRLALERDLGHPEATAEEKRPIDHMREAALSEAHREEKRNELTTPTNVPEESNLSASSTQNTPIKEENSTDVTPPSVDQLNTTQETERDTKTSQIKRAPISDSYTPGATSSVRKDIDGDPYREPVEE